MVWQNSKEDSSRTHWPNKVDFSFGLLNYAVGIVTFWRFPYLAYENSGAPFFYIFLALYLVIGIPLVFLEIAWGQYGNLAPLLAFKAVPAMQGVGICMLFLCCGLIVYFGSASYYILIYLASSFSYKQPWTTCENTWNTAFCHSSSGCNQSVLDGNSHVVERDILQIQSCNKSMDLNYSTPSVEFWSKNLAYADNICAYHPEMNKVLIGLDSSNVILAPFIVMSCFAAAKLLLSLIALANYVRWTGKIAYILTPMPFIILVIMLVRCVTLEGAVDGISALFLPHDASSFMNPKVWKDACSQVFLTLLVSSGGLVTWSSYNRFYHKYQFDATVLLVTLPIVSTIAAVTVFSVAGYFAFLHNTDPLLSLQDAKGPLAPLVAYSEAAFHMWGGSVPWGIVIFSVLFLSSSTSMFPFMECILSSMADAIPSFRNLYLRNITSFVLNLMFMAAYFGVPCFLQGAGLQIIHFFDTFSITLSLIIVALAETLLVFYSFGFKLLFTNTKAMTGSTCLKSHFWSFLWGGLTPLVMLACLVYTIYGMFAFGVDTLAPTTNPKANSFWINVAGGVLVGFIFLLWFIVALIRVGLSSGSCAEKFRNAFCAHSSRYSGNASSYSPHRNGNLFLSEYSSQKRGRIEMLIDDDDITTV